MQFSQPALPSIWSMIVGKQVSDVNRWSGATEVWVVKDFCIREDYLAARRQRLTEAKASGSWRGPYHARDMAVNRLPSSQPGEPAMAFAHLEGDFKRLHQGGTPGKQTASAPPSVMPRASQEGTQRQREIALSRRDTDPVLDRVPIQSSYADKANIQYRNTETFMLSLIFPTPA